MSRLDYRKDQVRSVDGAYDFSRVKESSLPMRFRGSVSRRNLFSARKIVRPCLLQ